MNLVPRLLRSSIPGIMTLAALGGAMTPLEAQTLLVGNLAQTTVVGGAAYPGTPTTWEAEAFTTKPDSHCNLFAVDLDLPSGLNGAIVHLYSMTGTTPGAPLSGFDGGSQVSGTIFRFLPLASVTLSANTTYWIVLSSSASTPWNAAVDTTADPGSKGSIPAINTWAEFTTGKGSWTEGDLMPYKFAVYYTDGTVVTLSSFTARTASTGVTVAWTTGSEVDTAGFNVWRAATADGEYTKLNASLLPSTAVSPGGASYAWTDAGGTSGFYKLEDVDTKGVSTMHGPVTVTANAFTLQDMAGLSLAWGSAKGDSAYNASYDLNGDGKVDDTDVALCFQEL